MALQDRFILSIRPAYLFLKATGVDLIDLEADGSWTKKRWIKNAWSCFWLLLNTLSGIYIFFRRGIQPILNVIFTSGHIREKVSWTLTAALMRATTFLFETTTHYILVLSIRPTLDRFFIALDPVDARLGRPHLSDVRRLATASVLFTVLTVVIKAGSALHLETRNWINWFYVTSWVDVVSNAIRLTNTLFTLMAIWLFVFCSQVLMVYQEKMACRLQEAVAASREEIVWEILTDCRILVKVKCRLLRDFRYMLTANCCLSVMVMLTSTYFFIDSIRTQMWPLVVWGSFSSVEFCLRFWLICHTTDRVRLSGKECIPILRKARDGITSPETRLKVTLFIIEMAKSSSCQNGHENLYGMLHIRKALVLQSIETISSFLVVIFQMDIASS